jgi:hypothetical protein
LRAYDVVFHARTGAEVRRRTVTAPLARHRNTIVSFVRDVEAKTKP